MLSRGSISDRAVIVDVLVHFVRVYDHPVTYQAASFEGYLHAATGSSTANLTDSRCLGCLLSQAVREYILLLQPALMTQHRILYQELCVESRNNVRRCSR